MSASPARQGSLADKCSPQIPHACRKCIAQSSYVICQHNQLNDIGNAGLYMQCGDRPHLGDAALHDEEVRVVDVELHGVEQVLHAAAVSRTCCVSHQRQVSFSALCSSKVRQGAPGLCNMAVDEVLVAPANHQLPHTHTPVSPAAQRPAGHAPCAAGHGSMQCGSKASRLVCAPGA